MARFKRSTDVDTIRADWWDSGVDIDGTTWEECVTLKPILTYEMQQRATREGLRPPPGVSMDQFQKADAMQILRWSDELSSQKLLMQLMVVDWSFYYDPSPDQESRGEHGDKVPFNGQTISELPREDFEFIMDEINKRGRSVKVKAEADAPGFRSGDADEVGTEGPVSS